MLRRLLCLLALAVLPTACGDPDRPGVPEPLAPAVRQAYDSGGRLTTGAPSPGHGRPNVILVLIDTLRADAIDLAQERGGTMPYLASLARAGVCFTQASSAAPWTLPSVMSLFSGLLPHGHGVTSEDLGAPSLAGRATWAEILAAQGYETAAFVGTVWPQARGGLLQGFQRVQEDFSLQGAAALLAPWIRGRDPARPFFLVLHSYEAHDPYGAANHPWPDPPPLDTQRAQALLTSLGPRPPAHELVRRLVLEAEVRELLQRNPLLDALRTESTRYLWSGLVREPRPALAHELEGAYREGLAWVDGQLRKTVEHLERSGLLENTLLIVTGDHGEAFGEHGMLLHGRTLYDELLRVPLALRGPPPFDRPRVVGASVGLTDLLPTVLDMLGLPPPDGAEGTSLRDVVEHGGPGRLVEAEEVRTHYHTAGESVALLGSVRTATRKVIGTYEMKDGTYREEVYDLAADPGEHRDLAGADGLAGGLAEHADLCRALERLRERLWAASARAESAAAGGAMASQLRPIARERPTSPCPPR